MENSLEAQAKVWDLIKDIRIAMFVTKARDGKMSAVNKAPSATMVNAYGCAKARQTSGPPISARPGKSGSRDEERERQQTLTTGWLTRSGQEMVIEGSLSPRHYVHAGNPVRRIS